MKELSNWSKQAHIIIVVNNQQYLGDEIKYSETQLVWYGTFHVHAIM